MRADSFLPEPLSPFRLDLTVWVVRRRPDNVVDRWDGHTYRRVVPLPAGPVEVAVTQIQPRESSQAAQSQTGAGNQTDARQNTHETAYR